MDVHAVYDIYVRPIASSIDTTFVYGMISFVTCFGEHTEKINSKIAKGKSVARF